ncbi:MAG: branched-chain amino acid ABC transporter permease [Xanthobacteraceae bacterium]|nr:branched-chain amino acid ABC transporter permease [Xanthobacteraceae bacterium]
MAYRATSPSTNVAVRQELGEGAHLAAFAVVSVAVAAIPLIISNPFYLYVATAVFINAIIVIGLMLIAYVGQLSLAQAAFAGIGAYTSVMVTMSLGQHFLVGVVAAIVSSAIVAVGLGWLTLRSRGVYFVLVSFAFAQIIYLALLHWEPITGGAVGLNGIPVPNFFGYEIRTGAGYYYLALIALVLVYFAVRAILASPAGRAFRSVNGNLRLAEACGIPTRKYMLLAFTLGSALAGLGGSLQAHHATFISPGSFHVTVAVNLILMLILGGRTSLIGAILGAAFVTPLPEFLRSAQEMQNILFGVVILIVLRFLPAGIVSILPRLRQLFTRARAQ